MTYWQRLLAWLGISEPGSRKEQVEDWIAANKPKMEALIGRQQARHAAKRHFFQRLRAWAKPSDDQDDQPKDLDNLPLWCDLSIDVYEAPDGSRPNTRKGWRLNIHVTETNATEWTLTVDSTDGSLGWTQKTEPQPMP